MSFDSFGLELRAQIIAHIRHGDMMWGEEPYIEHLLAVTNILKEVGVDDPEILAAGFLHDTLEDTDMTFEELEREFGKRVATLVELVTDKPGKNRHERHVNTYPLTRTNPDAILVKLADRLANVRKAKAEESNFLDMYKKEHEYFRETLHRGEECTDAEIWLWHELGELFKWETKPLGDSSQQS